MAEFRKRVLWADDEIELLRAHVMFLETRGYNVTPVFSGDDAVELVRGKEGNFDIVLLDEQMPGKDGLATLVEIKELRPDLPVVMVTKSEEEDLMEQAIGKKIDGYLTKPVNPSQILLVCKRLLDSTQYIASELKQQFLRNYTENMTAMRGRLETAQWIRLYEHFARWDSQLDGVEDVGLRQTHAGQKADGNAAFGEFITENYGHWIAGQSNPPVFSPGVLEKVVDPLLRKGERVYLIVVSGMRLDQYLSIEQHLRRSFSVQRTCYFSILPTDTRHARASLFSGLYPEEIADRYAKDWAEDGRETSCRLAERFLADRLKRSGIKLSGKLLCTYMNASGGFETAFKRHVSSPFVVLVADPISKLTTGGDSSLVSDERALRSMTRTWFETSAMLPLLTDLSRQKCTVILTSDHGSVFCTRRTELYGARDIGEGLRYQFGGDISADERRTVTLSDPRHFRLPGGSKKASQCIIAKENYYFSVPENFKGSQVKNSNSFQQGGISLEEMIVPLAILRPL